MKYMALIYADERAVATANEQQKRELFAGFMKFTEDVKKAGQYQTGAPLEASSTATTIRVSGGKTVATDGPYAESKEQLAGYYILDCADLDQAMDLASRICRLYHHPDVAVEVRPVRQMPG